MATPITFCILCLFLCSMVNANIEGDALIAFKQTLSDPNNALYSWDSTFVNPCTWIFVTCNGETQVTHLEMPGRNLSGQLVPQLGDLQHLQYMSLENNNLQGTIPAELGNLINLVTLDLHNNDLTGPIPPSFGNLKSLKILRLNDNQGLTGIVPPGVSTLPNLQMLNVSDTNIVGGPLTPETPKTIPSKSMATPLGHFKLFSYFQLWWLFSFKFRFSYLYL